MKTSLTDIRGLPDPLYGYNFDLIIPNVPGGGNSRELTIKVMTTSIPGMSLDDVTVTLKGIDVKYAGRQMFTHTLEATYMETRNLSTHDAISQWIRLARDVRTNTGSLKNSYATTANLVLYDDSNNPVRTYVLDGFFPQTIGDSSLDSGSSTPVSMSVTFAYDTWTVS
jgi:hypothetical protein